MAGAQIDIGVVMHGFGFANESLGILRQSFERFAAVTDTLEASAKRMGATLENISRVQQRMGESSNDAAGLFDNLSEAISRGRQEQVDYARTALETNKALTELGIATATIVGQALTSLARGFIDAAINMEQFKLMLTATGGSASFAADQMQRLISMSKLPGLELAGVFQGVAALQATGVNAELAERAIREVGNALAAVGRPEDLSGVVRAFSQIQAKGTVYAEEVQQIAERMPQIRTVLQDTFGTGRTEEIQKMGLTANEFLGLLVDGMGRLDRVGDNTQNTLKNFRNSIIVLQAEIGKTILPIIQEWIERLTSLVKWFNSLPAIFKSVIGYITLFGGAMLTAIATLGTLIHIGRTFSQALAQQTLSLKLQVEAVNALILAEKRLGYQRTKSALTSKSKGLYGYTDQRTKQRIPGKIERIQDRLKSAQISHERLEGDPATIAASERGRLAHSTGGAISRADRSRLDALNKSIKDQRSIIIGLNKAKMESREVNQDLTKINKVLKRNSDAYGKTLDRTTVHTNKLNSITEKAAGTMSGFAGIVKGMVGSFVAMAAIGAVIELFSSLQRSYSSFQEKVERGIPKTVSSIEGLNDSVYSSLNLQYLNDPFLKSLRDRKTATVDLIGALDDLKRKQFMSGDFSASATGLKGTDLKKKLDEWRSKVDFDAPEGMAYDADLTKKSFQGSNEEGFGFAQWWARFGKSMFVPSTASWTFALALTMKDWGVEFSEKLGSSFFSGIKSEIVLKSLEEEKLEKATQDVLGEISPIIIKASNNYGMELELPQPSITNVEINTTNFDQLVKPWQDELNKKIGAEFMQKLFGGQDYLFDPSKIESFDQAEKFYDEMAKRRDLAKQQNIKIYQAMKSVSAGHEQDNLLLFRAIDEGMQVFSKDALTGLTKEDVLKAFGDPNKLSGDRFKVINDAFKERIQIPTFEFLKGDGAKTVPKIIETKDGKALVEFVGLKFSLSHFLDYLKYLKTLTAEQLKKDTGYIKQEVIALEKIYKAQLNLAFNRLKESEMSMTGVLQHAMDKLGKQIGKVEEGADPSKTPQMLIAGKQLTSWINTRQLELEEMKNQVDAVIKQGDEYEDLMKFTPGGRGKTNVADLIRGGVSQTSIDDQVRVSEFTRKMDISKAEDQLKIILRFEKLLSDRAGKDPNLLPLSRQIAGLLTEDPSFANEENFEKIKKLLDLYSDTSIETSTSITGVKTIKFGEQERQIDDAITFFEEKIGGSLGFLDLSKAKVKGDTLNEFMLKLFEIDNPKVKRLANVAPEIALLIQTVLGKKLIRELEIERFELTEAHTRNLREIEADMTRNETAFIQQRAKDSALRGRAYQEASFNTQIAEAEKRSASEANKILGNRKYDQLSELEQASYDRAVEKGEADEKQIENKRSHWREEYTHSVAMSKLENTKALEEEKLNNNYQDQKNALISIENERGKSLKSLELEIAHKRQSLLLSLNMLIAQRDMAILPEEKDAFQLKINHLNEIMGLLDDENKFRLNTLNEEYALSQKQLRLDNERLAITVDLNKELLKINANKLQPSSGGILSGLPTIVSELEKFRKIQESSLTETINKSVLSAGWGTVGSLPAINNLRSQFPLLTQENIGDYIPDNYSPQVIDILGDKVDWTKNHESFKASIDGITDKLLNSKEATEFFNNSVLKLGELTLGTDLNDVVNKKDITFPIDIGSFSKLDESVKSENYLQELHKRAENFHNFIKDNLIKTNDNFIRSSSSGYRELEKTIGTVGEALRMQGDVLRDTQIANYTRKLTNALEDIDPTGYLQKAFIISVFFEEGSEPEEIRESIEKSFSRINFSAEDIGVDKLNTILAEVDDGLENTLRGLGLIEIPSLDSDNLLEFTNQVYSLSSAIEEGEKNKLGESSTGSLQKLKNELNIVKRKIVDFYKEVEKGNTKELTDNLTQGFTNLLDTSQITTRATALDDFNNKVANSQARFNSQIAQLNQELSSELAGKNRTTELDKIRYKMEEANTSFRSGMVSIRDEAGMTNLSVNETYEEQTLRIKDLEKQQTESYSRSLFSFQRNLDDQKQELERNHVLETRLLEIKLGNTKKGSNEETLLLQQQLLLQNQHRLDSIEAYEDYWKSIQDTAKKEILGLYSGWKGYSDDRKDLIEDFNESLQDLNEDLNDNLTDLADDRNKTFREKEEERLRIVKEFHKKEEDLTKEHHDSLKELQIQLWDSFKQSAIDRSMDMLVQSGLNIAFGNPEDRAKDSVDDIKGVMRNGKLIKDSKDLETKDIGFDNTERPNQIKDIVSSSLFLIQSAVSSFLGGAPKKETLPEEEKTPEESTAENTASSSVENLAEDIRTSLSSLSAMTVTNMTVTNLNLPNILPGSGSETVATDVSIDKVVQLKKELDDTVKGENFGQSMGDSLSSTEAFRGKWMKNMGEANPYALAASGAAGGIAASALISGGRNEEEKRKRSLGSLVAGLGMLGIGSLLTGATGGLSAAIAPHLFTAGSAMAVRGGVGLFDDRGNDIILQSMAKQAGQSQRSAEDMSRLVVSGFKEGYSNQEQASGDVSVSVSGHFELGQRELQYIADETNILRKRGVVG